MIVQCVYLQIRDGELAQEASRTLTELMHCRYHELRKFLPSAKMSTAGAVVQLVS